MLTVSIGAAVERAFAQALLPDLLHMFVETPAIVDAGQPVPQRELLQQLSFEPRRAAALNAGITRRST